MVMAVVVVVLLLLPLQTPWYLVQRRTRSLHRRLLKAGLAGERFHPLLLLGGALRVQVAEVLAVVVLAVWVLLAMVMTMAGINPRADKAGVAIDRKRRAQSLILTISSISFTRSYNSGGRKNDPIRTTFAGNAGGTGR